MARKHKQKAIKNHRYRRPLLPRKIGRWIWGVVMFLLAIIVSLAFFDLAGVGGRVLKAIFLFLIGRTIFVLPLILILGGLMFFSARLRSKVLVLLTIGLLVLGICGLLSSLKISTEEGGWLGYLISWVLLKGFGLWVSIIIFSGISFIGCLMVFQFLKPEKKEILSSKVQDFTSPAEEGVSGEVSGFKSMFKPKFKVKELEISAKERKIKTGIQPLDISEGAEKIKVAGYQPPPLDLLESETESPAAGDIRVNSAIIKKTLQNFDIPVEMSEVNIGPTVTQYTFKPAEGIKLSKITALNNDLALALASHPLRIEAPIPGRPLVGIEVPNKRRATVRLRNLFDDSRFQNAGNLTLVLGRDVAGAPMYVDLSKMPHLLVAGSTGSGKTICLNTIILSLLYQHGPGLLRFILVDPKRVEFPVYNDLPHLLCPVIFGAQKTINVLKWLTQEMERRFDILAAGKARDINNYNRVIANKQKMTGEESLPMAYIVVIIDELADLMAARGKEVETGIVRLAQMARAVGIHLVVATQRPSVEVITGLIKANITSRVSFQVASQVDSRTILDMAGAEKLLGRGDLLFLSAETAKPKRIQGAYVSEKEVKRVVQHVKSKMPSFGLLVKEEVESNIEKNREELEGALEDALSGEGVVSFAEEDPLYEQAKRIVFEARKASASLLQRRLRLGYARAARLIDILEERGVVGPAEGAKPREVYILKDDEENGEENIGSKTDEGEGFKPVNF